MTMTGAVISSVGLRRCGRGMVVNGGWVPYCVLGTSVGRQGRVDVMNGAGRRDSVACEVR